MAITHRLDSASSAPEIPVRTIGAADLNASLREGMGDFLAMRGDLLFIGLIYTTVGLLAALLALGESVTPFFFPLAAGLSLLGPIAALGFYELARRREAGLEADWSHFLDVPKRPGWDSIVTVSALLIAIFLAWIVTAGALYEAFMGGTPASVGAFIRDLFATPGGWALIVFGNLAGLGFAILVLSLSVVSLPMLVDRDVDTRIALATSVRAVKANKAVMARWGLIVAALLFLGSLPAFVGLAVVLPWLGYATWHLYTRLVDRSALPPG
jgi:uncharacterized membrane protein